MFTWANEPPVESFPPVGSFHYLICNIIGARNCAQRTAKRPRSIEFHTLIFGEKSTGENWLFLSTNLHSKEEIGDLKTWISVTCVVRPP